MGFFPCLCKLSIAYSNRYTAENFVKYGAPRDTGNPEVRQPLASEIWESTLKTQDPRSKMTLLVNGPLTNLAKLFLSDKNASFLIEVSGLICSLNYLTISRPDISFAVQQVRQFMQSPRLPHLGAVRRILWSVVFTFLLSHLFSWWHIVMLIGQVA